MYSGCFLRNAGMFIFEISFCCSLRYLTYSFLFILSVLGQASLSQHANSILSLFLLYMKSNGHILQSNGLFL